MGSALVANPRAQAAGLSVRLPCLEADEIPTCGKTLRPRIDLQACSKVLATSSGAGQLSGGILGRIEREFDHRIDCFYQGYVPNLTYDNRGVTATGPGANATGADRCDQGFPAWGQGVQKVVCNMADGEDDRNHHGGRNESCGAIEDTYEDSHFQGLYVQAMKYYRQQVIDELTTQRRLAVSPKCEAIAYEYGVLDSQGKVSTAMVPGSNPPKASQLVRIKENSDLLVSASSILPAQVYLGAVNYCDTPDNIASIRYEVPACVPKTDCEWCRTCRANGTCPDCSCATMTLANAIKGAGSCEIQVQRELLLYTFGQLASCEVFARLDRYFAETSPRIVSRFVALGKACVREAENAQEPSVFHSCYRVGVKKFFKEVSDEYFPGQLRSDAGAKSSTLRAQAADFSKMDPGLRQLLFGLGMSFWPFKGPRKRLRARWRSIAGRTGQFIALNVVILSFATYYSLGGCCGGGGGGSSFPTLVVTCVGVQTQGQFNAVVGMCCDPANPVLRKPNLSYQDCLRNCGAMYCPPPQGENAAGGGLQFDDSDDRFDAGVSPNARAVDAGQLAVNQANPLSGRIGGGGAFATAGKGGLGLNTGRGAKKNGSSANDRLAGSNGGAGGGAGFGSNGVGGGGGAGAGGEGLSGGGASSLGLGTTAPGDPSLGGAGGPTSAGALGADGGDNGTYRSANGASAATAGGANAKDGWNALGGGSGGAGLTGVNGEESFGVEGAKSETTVEDPADYFTRPGADENLFRRVKRQHDKKALRWSKEDAGLAGAAPNSKPVSK